MPPHRGGLPTQNGAREVRHGRHLLVAAPSKLPPNGLELHSAERYVTG